MHLDDPAIERHVELALTLDEELENRGFWITFRIVDVPNGKHPDVNRALVDELDAWLASMDDLPVGEIEERDFEIGSFLFNVRVARKGDRVRERGGTVIANPYPALAYWIDG